MTSEWLHLRGRAWKCSEGVLVKAWLSESSPRAPSDPLPVSSLCFFRQLQFTEHRLGMEGMQSSGVLRCSDAHVCLKGESYRKRITCFLV